MNLLKNKVFYISFVVFFLTFYYYTGSDQLFSFFRLGQWTNLQNIKVSKDYKRKWYIDNTVIWTTIGSLELWEWSYWDFHNIELSIDLLRKSHNLINTNTLELMKWSKYKASVLEWHIQQQHKLLSNINTTLHNINQQKQRFNSHYQQSQAQRQQWESHIQQWLDRKDPNQVINGLERRLEHGPDYIKNETKFQAYWLLQDRLTKHQKLLKQKYNLIRSNKDLLVENTSVFEQNKINQLQNIQNQLKKFQTDSSNYNID